MRAGPIVLCAQRRSLHCLILVALGTTVRLPALFGEFIWDDASLVRDNPLIKSPLLWLESFRHYLALDGSSAHYRPLQTISYFFDYLVWNIDPFGYHLTNLALHVSCGVLLYFLLERLLAPWRPRFTERPELLSLVAFSIALIWVVHPVQSAAVDYISGRADSLAFFFAAAAWLLFCHARTAQSSVRRIAPSVLCALSALASLCSRETGCIWMALFLLHLFVLDRESPKHLKAAVATICLLLLGSYAALRRLPVEHLLSSTAPSLPLIDRAVLMLRALGDYAQLMVFPINLHLERTVVPSALTTQGWRDLLAHHYLSFIGAFAAIAMTCGAIRKGKAQPVRILGATWFVIAYLPVSNLFPMNATVAEHWLYLPSVGFLIFVAGFWLESAPRHNRLVAGAASLAVLALSIRSFIRSGDWSSPQRFYQQSLAAGAVDTRFSLNLAQSYAQKHEFAKAEALLRSLVAAHPGYVMAHNALGHVLLEQSKAEEAARVFARAENLARATTSNQPRNWIAALNLAYIKHSQHEETNALVILDQARAHYPGIWRLITFESEILRENGQQEKALALVQDFRARHRWHYEAALELGRIHYELHRYSDATAIWEYASRLDVHDAESLNRIAALNIEQSQLHAACAAQERAARRRPEEPHQYLLLADVLERSGRHAEAQEALAKVRSLRALAVVPPMSR